jgi:toxin ParE1/3/4
MKLRWSSKAESDLVSIRDYTRTQWGNPQAIRYVKSIREAVRAAAKAPLQAAPADHFNDTMRKITIGSHIIFFRIADGSIEILRVMHGAMDIPPKLD